MSSAFWKSQIELFFSGFLHSKSVEGKSKQHGTLGVGRMDMGLFSHNLMEGALPSV